VTREILTYLDDERDQVLKAIAYTAKEALNGFEFNITVG